MFTCPNSQELRISRAASSYSIKSPASCSSLNTSLSEQFQTKGVSNPASQITKSIWAPVATQNVFDVEALMYDTSYTGSDDLTCVSSSLSEPQKAAFSNSISLCKSIWSPADNSMEVSRPNTATPSSGSFTTISTSSTANNSLQQPPESYLPTDSFNPTNFHYLVDKIVKTNDQPASLFLQHKLRFSTVDVNAQIFAAIVIKAPPLMRNRFGNFLMQKVIEHGSPDQLLTIGRIIRQNISSLATDRFACHVVQKALDHLSLDMKYTLMDEMLKSAPHTITHKFGCHVWQRLFETSWDSAEKEGKPPRLMQGVEASLNGQWHSLANDENGSLVLQCIFENSNDSERAPIVEQVLSHMLEISMGQWGNWVVQHIVEHGSSQNREAIIKMLTANVFVMSIDQYASKVVEKILKIAAKKQLAEIIESVIKPQRNQKYSFHLT